MRKEKTEHSARLPFAASMLIFGTIGLLRRFIDLPSGVIACFRGLLGCVLLLLLQRLGGKKPGLAAIRKSLLPLLISGGMIGFNWMLLFEAYRYTSIAVATLCYYTAPVMLILASPFVFHERLTWRQLVCVGLAACGMVLVSGVLDGGTLPDGTLTGIALAVGSAVLYAAITAVNRKALPSLDAYDKTIVQLGAAGLVMAPYLALTGGFFGDFLPQLAGIINPNTPFKALPSLFTPLDDTITILIGAMALGFVQIVTGMAISFVEKLKKGEIMDAIWEELTWWVVFAGIACMALGVTNIVLYVGIGMVVVGSGWSAKGFGKVTAIFGSVYNHVTGYFGDILSYSRLMTLMLAGSVIASVFNTLGAIPGNVVIFLIVSMLGNGLNFALNLLSCYVHDLRLQCLEYFGKFYKDGGRPFKPLAINTKYVDIQS